MADIIVTDVVKSFEQDRRVLDGISFRVDPGERVAILGDNGAGKTTLFRILTGELTPDLGSVSIARKKRVGYVAQLNTASSDDTVEDVLRHAYDEVISLGKELERFHDHMETVSAAGYDDLLRRFEALGGYEWETEMARVANGLNIDAEMRSQRFNTLSGGEQTRVSLARMIMEKTDILLLDEPTNHLDMASLEWLEDYLLHYKGTVLLISHDRYFLDTVAQRIIEIRHGKAEFYSGSYSYYVEEKELRYQQQLMQYNREQAKVKQLEFQIARLKAWGSVYDNPALHKKAAAMEKRVERVQQTEKPTRDIRMQADFASQSFRADQVLQLENISKGFDGQTLFSGVTAVVRGNQERIAILGPNGTGKSTLLKIILNQIAPDTGTVTFGPSVKVAWMPQQIQFEHPERNLIDTLLFETSCSPQETRDRLGVFRFSGEDQFKQVSQLSGGERARLKLCIIMLNQANLLILDEPTNHLDLSSREWIEEAVSHFQGNLIFVSHDRYFVKRFANRVWDLEGGFTDYPDSDYDRYHRIKALKAASAPSVPAPKPEKKEKAPEAAPKAPGARDPKTERKRSALEREIAAKEEELAAFDVRMEAVASDYVELEKLTREKAELEQQIEEMYIKWDEL